MSLEQPDSQPEQVFLTSVEELPTGAAVVEAARLRSATYQFTYTTGPFLLPANTHSLGWGVLNNASVAQTVRVTVFKCPIGSVKTADPPGPLDISVPPGQATHNANQAVGGFFYEIQVESNSRRVFPYAAAWPGAAGDPIPGSVVKAAEFIRRMP